MRDGGAHDDRARLAESNGLWCHGTRYVRGTPARGWYAYGVVLCVGPQGKLPCASSGRNSTREPGSRSL